MSEENNKYKLSVVKNNYLTKVSNTLSITNKLLKEIDNREPSDDYRVAILDVNFQKYLSEELGIEVTEGTVTYEDVKNVSEIKCPNRSIESLEGIEFFISLEILNCGENNLFFLDVTKNKNLTNLSCHKNNLESLDVTKNNRLISLYCYRNKLVDLDVTENIILTLLNCGENNLFFLDVTKNKNLTNLYCYGNDLKSLDVTKNLSLITLEIENNFIENIDVSKNIYLEDFFYNDDDDDDYELIAGIDY